MISDDLFSAVGPGFTFLPADEGGNEGAAGVLEGLDQMDSGTVERNIAYIWEFYNRRKL